MAHILTREVAVPVSTSVPAGFRYVLTPEGRKALKSAEACTCVPRIQGLLLVCVECETVYGNMSTLVHMNERYRDKRP